MTTGNSSHLWQVQEPRAEYGAFQRVKTVKVKSRLYPNKTVPMIVLSGQWLEQAGFTIGTIVEVQAFQNGLKLCIDEKE